MLFRTRILVVDDSPINRDVLHEVLDDVYEVEYAANAADALRHVRQQAWHIVLLDVMLPDADGCDLCRSIRQQQGMRDARIIMLSAKAMPQERAKGLRAGADAYLTKPFDYVELLKLIEKPSGVAVAS